MGTLGYHVIIWDLDTDDYNQDSPQLIQNSKNNFLAALNNADPSYRSFLSIALVLLYRFYSCYIKVWVSADR